MTPRGRDWSNGLRGLSYPAYGYRSQSVACIQNSFSLGQTGQRLAGCRLAALSPILVCPTRISLPCSGGAWIRSPSRTRRGTSWPCPCWGGILACGFPIIGKEAPLDQRGRSAPNRDCAGRASSNMRLAIADSAAPRPTGPTDGEASVQNARSAPAAKPAASSFPHNAATRSVPAMARATRSSSARRSRGL